MVVFYYYAGGRWHGYCGREAPLRWWLQATWCVMCPALARLSSLRPHPVLGEARPSPAPALQLPCNWPPVTSCVPPGRASSRLRPGGRARSLRGHGAGRQDRQLRRDAAAAGGAPRRASPDGSPSPPAHASRGRDRALLLHAPTSCAPPAVGEHATPRRHAGAFRRSVAARSSRRLRRVAASAS